jgi:two-component system cell cycle response regulator
MSERSSSRGIVQVLVAEDETLSRRRLQTLLQKWGYSVVIAVDGVEALRVMEAADHPKLVILDRMMPHVDGLEVCRAIRRDPREPYVYIVLLTGRGEQKEIIEGFDAGADDYITKPFEIRELQARLKTGARIVELQEQLIAAREELRTEAMRDGLTGFYNRSAFFDLFQKEVARATRQQTPLALIIGDLDHFKSVNDCYGHIAGDTVLKEAARRMGAALRGTDVMGRYGGEEFVVAASNCSYTEALDLTERFRSAICAWPFQVPNGSLSITMSFGVAVAHDMKAAGDLLRAADEALYRAKHGGRNRVEAAEDPFALAVDTVQPVSE